MTRQQSSKALGRTITQAWRYLGKDIMYESYEDIPQQKTETSKGETPRDGDPIPEKRVDDGEISESREQKLALTRLATAPDDKALESMGMAETNPVTK